jgi:hypothetical protein
MGLSALARDPSEIVSMTLLNSFQDPFEDQGHDDVLEPKPRTSS